MPVRAGGVRGAVELAEIGVPDFGLPTAEPSVPTSTYQARLASAVHAAVDAGLDALLVYADGEHFANLSYLTRFDPRFEEALLILVPGRAPALLVGNEGVSYAPVVPAGIDVIRCQSFSLVPPHHRARRRTAGQLDRQAAQTGDRRQPAGAPRGPASRRPKMTRGNTPAMSC